MSINSTVIRSDKTGPLLPDGLSKKLKYYNLTIQKLKFQKVETE